MDDRKAFEAIVYVLRMRIQWNALPRELGASSTVHDRFQEWSQAGFFKALWQAGLSEYAELANTPWEWQTVDGEVTKAPFVKAAVGARPVSCGQRWGRVSFLKGRRGMFSNA
jgi:putative transposase